MSISGDHASGPTAGNAAEATASFTYSAAEDRILGQFAQGGAGATVLLTRRLVRQVIARLAQLLERSSSIAERAPAMMRAEVVQFEHQSAVAQLATTKRPAPGTVGAAAPEATTLLIARVDLTPQPPGFVLVLSDAAGRNVTLRLQWQDLHRLVGALHRQACVAQWDLADTVPWLAASPGSAAATA